VPTVPPPAQQRILPSDVTSKPMANPNQEQVTRQMPNPSITGAPYAGTSQSGSKTWAEELRDKRHDKELESAFASSMVSETVSANSSQTFLRSQDGQWNVPPRSPEPTGEPPQAAQSAPHDQKPPSELAFNPALAVYWLPEGTVINAVLDSQLEGEMTGPIDAHVSMDVYVRNSRILIIPKGSKLQGESQKVAAVNQTRLAVAFHSVQVYLPGAIQPYVISLDDVPTEDRMGGVGVTGKVNNHFFKILGGSLAAGLVQGLSEGAGYGHSNGVIIGLGQGGQSGTGQLLNRYTNLLPTITIPAGQRMIIELTGDLKVPAYEDVRHEVETQ
jgi:type IV secretory pathway VirB10-like protein